MKVNCYCSIKKQQLIHCDVQLLYMKGDLLQGKCPGRKCLRNFVQGKFSRQG